MRSSSESLDSVLDHALKNGLPESLVPVVRDFYVRHKDEYYLKHPFPKTADRASLVAHTANCIVNTEFATRAYIKKLLEDYK